MDPLSEFIAPARVTYPRALTVLISGAGSGMGLHTAQTLLRQGYAVYAGIRDPQGRNQARAVSLQAYAAEHGAQVSIVDLDILHEDSCRAAVAQVLADYGCLDVVVHNAAHLFIGFSEAFTPEQLASSLNTNVLGAHRLNRAALPVMRQQGSGLLLYVGSGISRIVYPFMAPYVVGKTALDALAEATAYEVGRFGVETTILMPGVFTSGTDHFKAAEFAQDATTMAAYAPLQADFDQGDASLQRLFYPGQDAPVQGVADEIVRVLALPAGQRPRRTTVDYSDYGAEAVNAVAEAQTSRLFHRIGYEHLLAAAPVPAS